MEQLGDDKRAQQQARKTRHKDVRIKKFATFYKEKWINEKNEKRSLVVTILRSVKQPQSHKKKIWEKNRFKAEGTAAFQNLEFKKMEKMQKKTHLLKS